MARDPGARTPGITSQIIVAVFVALLAGGTAPWWWDAVTGSSSTTTSTTTTTTARDGGGRETTTTTAATTTTDAETTTTSEPPGDCRVAIGNPLAVLYEEPDWFSQEIMQIPAGEYRVIEAKTVTFVNEERWLRIDVNGTPGWIPDDTWTVDARKDCSF